MSLADAIINQDIRLVEQLAQGSVDLNAIDEYGFSPLTQAAIMDNVTIAEILLKAGAKPDQVDMSGRTALHWAADNSNIQFCELLLKHKADANAYTQQGQPVLTMPYLRSQQNLKKLLYDYGASLNFAQDFINAKLIGHRFELQGLTHIVNNKRKFILLDFEGFFLEFSLSLILDSLNKYKNNFLGKSLRPYFGLIEHMISSLYVASQLIQYQQYNVNLEKHVDHIQQLAQYQPLIIPAVYQGHAITFLKLGDWFAKCDRGENSQFESSLSIYRITRPEAYNLDLIHRLIYVKNTDQFMHGELNQILGLVPTYQIPLKSQVAGTCSWANVEATIPALAFMIRLYDNPDGNIDNMLREALNIFHQWREWDKDRALNECIQAINHNEPERGISKVGIIAHVLLDNLNKKHPTKGDVHRLQTMYDVLNKAEFRFIVDAYLNVYYKKNKTAAGEKLLELFGKRR